MKVDIYLRKSRSDEELEKQIGEGETLARHRNTLLKIVKERKYTLVNIHEEIVSGEELFFRPAMLEVLKDIETKVCDAVLVMDIQRLGRGDMEEQGLILKTFKNVGAKIITPEKIYDLSNEIDEEYSEFETFKSRMEYRMIKKRMQGGRIRSVEEGNYIATRPPYGYNVKKIDKKTRILIPHPEQSLVVKKIFDWYAYHQMGSNKIAKELIKLGIPSYTGGKWNISSITSVIKNLAYIGMITWKRKCTKKSKTPGKKKDTYTRPKEEWVIAKGKHQPIIDIETFEIANNILSSKYHPPACNLTNSLAGLVICASCGSKMVYRPYTKQKPHLMCIGFECNNKSSRFEYVENAVINALQNYYERYSLELDKKDASNAVDIEVLKNTLSDIQKEEERLNSQKLKLHDLLEQGVYDSQTFIERSKILAEKLYESGKSKETVNAKLKKLKRKKEELLPQIKTILDTYWSIDNAKTKNEMLKAIIEKIEYYKEQDWKNDHFQLKLYTKADA